MGKLSLHDKYENGTYYYRLKKTKDLENELVYTTSSDFTEMRIEIYPFGSGIIADVTVYPSMAINAGDSDEILLGEFYHLRTYRNLARAVRNKVYEIEHRIKTERPDELVTSLPKGGME